MNTKHTPGPWKATRLDANRYGIDTHDMNEVCEVRGASAANAALIAAAPELLKELKHLVALLEPLEHAGTLNVPGLATLNGARAAIAKAEGKE